MKLIYRVMRLQIIYSAMWLKKNYSLLGKLLILGVLHWLKTHFQGYTLLTRFSNACAFQILTWKIIGGLQPQAPVVATALDSIPKHSCITVHVSRESAEGFLAFVE